MVPEDMAGHADLAAADGAEHVLIEPRPVFDRIKALGLQTGVGDRHHGDLCWRTPVVGGKALRRQALDHHQGIDMAQLPVVLVLTTRLNCISRKPSRLAA